MAKAIQISRRNTDAWVVVALISRKLNQQDTFQTAYQAVQDINSLHPKINIFSSFHSLAPKPWGTGTLTSGYYNKEFWKIEVKDNRLIRKMIAKNEGL